MMVIPVGATLAWISVLVLASRVEASGSCPVPLFPAPHADVSGVTNVDSGDIDGDGDLDLVTTSYGLTSVLVNHGDGTFARLELPADDYQTSIALGDMNGDGALDIVRTVHPAETGGDIDPNPALLHVLLGHFDGSFDPPLVITPLTESRRLHVADFNGDGIADVAMASTVQQVGVAEIQLMGVVSIMFGQGGGLLGEPVVLSTFTWVYDIGIGDLDHDGNLDIAVAANNGGPLVTALLGDGLGGFTPVPGSPIPGFSLSRIALGDVNADGDLDAAVTSANRVDFLAGAGDGTFTDLSQYDIIHIASALNGDKELALGDLDADGDLDAVVPVEFIFEDPSLCLSLFFNHGDGTFDPFQPLEIGKEPKSIHLADLNQDGALDLTSYVFGAKALVTVLGHGDGTFDLPSPFMQPGIAPLEPSYPALAASDLNHDGIPDVVLFSSIGPKSFLGTGGGKFMPVIVDYEGWDNTDSVRLHDLNGDGHLDLFTMSDDASWVWTSLRYGHGDGTFDGDSLVVPLGLVDVRAFDLCDLNDDGSADLVLVSWEDKLVSTKLGTPFGYFFPATEYQHPASPGGVATADLNQDGFVDVVVTNPSPGINQGMSVYLGLGDGTLEPPMNFPSDPASWGQARVILTDLDGDGDLDAAAGGLAIHQGNGDGTFSMPDYPADVEYAAGAWFAADMTGDGLVEIVVRRFGAFLIFPGDGMGSVGEPQAFLDLTDDPQPVDIDGDGDIDMIGLEGNGLTDDGPPYPVFFENRLCDAALAGDLNSDGQVNGVDLGQFLLAFGPCPRGINCPADFNGDGVIDGADLGLLLLAWTE